LLLSPLIKQLLSSDDFLSDGRVVTFDTAMWFFAGGQKKPHLSRAILFFVLLSIAWFKCMRHSNEYLLVM